MTIPHHACAFMRMLDKGSGCPFPLDIVATAFPYRLMLYCCPVRTTYHLAAVIGGHLRNHVCEDPSRLPKVYFPTPGPGSQPAAIDQWLPAVFLSSPPGNGLGFCSRLTEYGAQLPSTSSSDSDLLTHCRNKSEQSGSTCEIICTRQNVEL